MAPASRALQWASAMGFKISVVTATLNRRAWLERCLESVAAQEHPDKEHVVVDGGSSDGTPGFLRDAARAYPHLRWISEPDRGISQALNRGLALASGDAVGILGDDDAYEPGAFSVVAAEFAQCPEAGLVSGSCHFVDNAGSLRFTQQSGFTSRSDLIQCWRYWGNRIALPGASTFISRAALDAVGGFDEADRYAMDYRHWIRISERFPVRTLPRVLGRFHYDTGTLSHAGTPDQWEETLRISRQHWGSPLGFGYWSFWLSWLWHYRRHRLGAALRRTLGIKAR